MKVLSEHSMPEWPVNRKPDERHDYRDEDGPLPQPCGPPKAKQQEREEGNANAKRKRGPILKEEVDRSGSNATNDARVEVIGQELWRKWHQGVTKGLESGGEPILDRGPFTRARLCEVIEEAVLGVMLSR
jgi:hypothetical protein